MKSIRSSKEPFKAKSFDLDFEKELTNACLKFGCHGVVVNKRLMDDVFLRALRAESRKVVNKRMSPTLHAPQSPTPDDKTVVTDDDNVTDDRPLAQPVDQATVVVDALYDHQQQLVEVQIKRATDIPRVLMQCLGLLCPYFHFLTKISILNSHINGYVIHELERILYLSSITDICLDGSFSRECNYHTLLDRKTKLRHLSLSNSCIDDYVCRQIALKLHFEAPAAGSLMILDLSSNRITDEGVKCLALALRTNRCLRYLNLADNRITDGGAFQLFEMLAEFPLTCDEIKQKRVRHMEYLKRKREVYLQFFEERDRKSIDEYSRKSGTSRKSKSTAGPRKSKKDVMDSDDFDKADYFCLEILGKYDDPFSPDRIKIKDDMSYCIGNMILCALNLSYNHLTFLSVIKLKSVMLYQSLVKNVTDYGLMKISVEGNLLPSAKCEEYDTIQQLLLNNVSHHMGHDHHRRGSMSLKQVKK